MARCRRTESDARVGQACCYSFVAMRKRLSPVDIGRRTFLRAGLTAFGGVSAACAAGPRRKFFSAFTPGSIGVQADQARSIRLAAMHGFESVQPLPRDLLRDGVESHLEALSESGLRWAAAGLPVQFRKSDAEFEQGMADLPTVGDVLQRAGVKRVGTWLLPSSDDLTYLQNFKRTAGRLRRVAEVLGERGLRLGLEYVGTKRNWTASRHSFVHTMAGTKELIAEIGLPNVGIVLDSWHWWTSSETGDDIKSLTNREVVSADLNDAPRGIAKEEQYDNQRELPLASGVIDAKEFLEALVSIGYDGPVRAEPFNKELNDKDDDEASRLSVAALNDAFALVG